MAFSKATSASISVPAHWTLPTFRLGERVVVFDYWDRLNIGVIRGMEFIDFDYNKSNQTDNQEGWWYSILIDEDSPLCRLEPVTQQHESKLMKYLPE